MVGSDILIYRLVYNLVENAIKYNHSGGQVTVTAYKAVSYTHLDPQVLPIIVVDRYLDYFTTIMEDRLWQVLAEPVSRWRNRSGLSLIHILNTVRIFCTDNGISKSLGGKCFSNSRCAL